jgi:dihydroorotate dehydrogenase electron transfer subunit
MPVDVSAEVVANTRLSPEYSVLALAAPQIAAAAAPGQFVMLKAAPGRDPLLRRPFSVFEVLRDHDGTPTGLTILNKAIGASTREIFEARPGQRMSCLGPLGRPFTLIDPPAEAWLVAGGVGLAPFATLAEALRSRGVRTTLFYGARRAAELFCLELFERLDVPLVLATDDGSRGVRGRVAEPLEDRLRNRAGDTPLMIYACGPERMLAACAKVADTYGQRCEVSVERVMGCGLGGCYSCVVPMRDANGTFHHVRSCLAGPVLDSRQIRWDA